MLVQLHPTCTIQPLPEPHSLQRLAPVLQSTQWPSLSAFSGDITELWRSSFSAEHVSVLHTAVSPLQGQVISDCGMRLISTRLNSSSISVVGSLLNLTTLHILHRDHLDFAPLQQLSRLRQLLLRSVRMDCEGCCCKVLESNKGHLQSVHLEAMSWSNKTYQAFEGLAHLRTLEMTLRALSTGQALIMGDLTQPQQVRIALLDCCEDNVKPCTMQALTAGRSRITWLQMSDAPYCLLQHMSMMDHLTNLEIVDPVSFTGLHMELQPHVKKLILQNVPDLSTEGLQQMISTLPALKYLYLGGCQVADRWMLSQDVSLAGLAQARHLKLISLCGLSDLSLTQVQELELAIRSQGEIGLAQPAVLLVMPQQVCQDNGNSCTVVHVGSSCPPVFSNMASNKTLKSACKRLDLHQVNARQRVILTIGLCLTTYAVRKVSQMCFTALRANSDRQQA